MLPPEKSLLSFIIRNKETIEIDVSSLLNSKINFLKLNKEKSNEDLGLLTLFGKILKEDSQTLKYENIAPNVQEIKVNPDVQKMVKCPISKEQIIEELKKSIHPK